MCVWGRLMACCETAEFQSSSAGRITTSSRYYGKCCWTTMAVSRRHGRSSTSGTNSCAASVHFAPPKVTMTSNSWNCYVSMMHRTGRNCNTWPADDFTGSWTRSIPLWPTPFTRTIGAKLSGKNKRPFLIIIFFEIWFHVCACVTMKEGGGLSKWPGLSLANLHIYRINSIYSVWIILFAVTRSVPINEFGSCRKECSTR